MRAKREAEPSHAGPGLCRPVPQPCGCRVGGGGRRTPEGKETAAGVRVQGNGEGDLDSSRGQEDGEKCPGDYLSRLLMDRVCRERCIKGDSQFVELVPFRGRRDTGDELGDQPDCLGSNPGCAAGESRHLGPLCVFSPRSGGQNSTGLRGWVLRIKWADRGKAQVNMELLQRGGSQLGRK